MQLRRMIIGVDFSGGSRAAARWAIDHFAPNADAVLVHSIVVPRPPRFLRGRFPPEHTLVETATAGAEQRLRTLRHELGKDDARIEVCRGRATEQLVMAARSFNADIIVVGTHGERAGVWRHLGSTAEQLIGTAPVPVLLVSGVRDAKPRRILVALDDAEVTSWVVKWTRFLSDHFSASVVAMHVVSSVIESHLLSMVAVGSGGAVAPSTPSVREELRQQSDAWVQELLRAGIPEQRVSSETAFGEAGQEIVAAAERLDADLIVMGSRGSGSVPRAVLGSVAREVLRRAPCPVFVVKEPTDFDGDNR